MIKFNIVFESILWVIIIVAILRIDLSPYLLGFLITY
ncbi:hypothetical protein DFP78_10359 [Photobacterium lutimaris]|nr:hypothetical protein DFP78_10359 [Photobacterium lutimaris]